jgi:hypothetical protein
MTGKQSFTGEREPLEGAVAENAATLVTPRRSRGPIAGELPINIILSKQKINCGPYSVASPGHVIFTW